MNQGAAGNGMHRVFIVEDEGIIAIDLQARLTELGYAVCGCAARGERALEEMADARPDVILMDIHLAGGINGIETAAKLRETIDVPVVFLSAFSDPELLHQAGQVEPFGYLVKPFEERELHATLQMALYRHRMDRQLREANARLEERVRERTMALESTNRQLKAEVEERRRVEEALRESEGFVEATLDSLPEHVCVIDQEGSILRTNRAWREFASGDAPVYARVLEGANYLAACEAATGEGAGDAAALAAGIRAMLKGECPRFSLEYPCHSLWEQRWFVAHLTRLVGPGPVRIVVSHETITGRKLIESELGRSVMALKASDMQRREAQRIARLGHWSLDVASGDIEWCEETYNIFGRDGRTFRPTVERYYREIVHPEDMPALRLEEERACQDGRQHRIDHRFLHADGSVRWVHLEGLATFDASGRPATLHGTVQDITERKQTEEVRRRLEAQLAEAHQRESEAQLASIVDSAMDAIITVDEAQRILVFNRAAEALFCCTATDAMGKSLESFIPRRFRAAHGEHMQAYSESGRTARAMGQTGRVRALRADGEEVSVEASISHVEVNGRQLYSVILRDATEREQAEAVREALETQLRESQKMEAMGTLAGGIAHDFNNILAAILGNAALARRDLGEGHKALVSLGEIDKAGARGRSMVQQILTFSRRQPQQMVIQRLAPLVEETIGLMRATLPAVVSLEWSASDDSIQVQADATQVGQVIINLCTNAWHSLEGRAGRIEVVLDAVQIDAHVAGLAGGLEGGRYARLRVNDEGCGMDEATQARMFDPFYTTKAVNQGTGLGLSVVHGIVKAHRGAISVRSAPGRGTTVEVLLPSAAGAAEGVTESRRESSVQDGRGRHVLYLDDDESMVFLVTRLLGEHGYRVSGFETARSALDAVRAAPGEYDLFVTDFNMPAASGLDVARELAAIRPDLPVMITSGYVTDELRKGAESLGVRHVIYKPGTVHEFCAIVQELLEQAPPRR